MVIIFAVKLRIHSAHAYVLNTLQLKSINNSARNASKQCGGSVYFGMFTALIITVKFIAALIKTKRSHQSLSQRACVAGSCASGITAPRLHPDIRFFSFLFSSKAVLADFVWQQQHKLLQKTINSVNDPLLWIYTFGE